jgi:hypothetical protein
LRAARSYHRGDQYGFGRFNVLYQAAILAHYTSDAHVPLHAVVNYTGQLTSQPSRIRNERSPHANLVDNLHERCPFRSSERTASRPQPL